MSAMDIAVFFSSAVAVFSALTTVFSRAPLRGAMSLLLHIVSLAILYLSINAHMLAAVQILVYAGAVVTLFVFVMMMMGGESRPSRPWNAQYGIGIVLILLAGGILFSTLSPIESNRPNLPICTDTDHNCVPYGGVLSVGRSLFRDSIVLFEMVGILLLVAVVGAMTVASSRADSSINTSSSRLNTSKNTTTSLLSNDSSLQEQETYFSSRRNL